MKKIETLYLEKYNEAGDPDKYITDFLHETGDIGDTLRDIADNATPVYIGGLLEWYENNFRDAAALCDEEIKDYGATTIQAAMSGAFYRWQLDQLEANKAELVELWTWGYIFKVLQINEITDEQAEAIAALDFDDFDDFDDVINEINEILLAEEDE